MGTLPTYYIDRRENESTLGERYELVMLAGHSVTGEPLYILKSLEGGLTEAVPFNEIGKTWRIDYAYSPDTVTICTNDSGPTGAIELEEMAEALEPIPPKVYWHPANNSFYHEDGSRMGPAFFNKWRMRVREFPKRDTIMGLCGGGAYSGPSTSCDARPLGRKD